MHSRHFILFILLILLAAPLTAQRYVLHCGSLVDVVNSEVLKKQTLIVEGDRIVEVRAGYIRPEKTDSLIDLTAYTVMPGFMDMHVHLEGESNPAAYLNEFQNNPEDIAYDAAVYARRTLMAGFTTVRDLGGTGVNNALRDAVKAGKVPGPRIYSAGKSIATTGGHADPTNGYRRDLMGNPGPQQGVINGPFEARQAVRQRYKDGSDVIKITATGGVLSVAKDGSGPQFQMDELEAIIQTAREYGMTTAAHAHGAEGMKRAVLAGITSIEHGTKMTEEVMDLMAERGTWYVPTISAGKYVAEKAEVEGFYPSVIVPKALEIGPMIQDTFGKAWRRGVPIAFGTDAGVSPHGDNAKEFYFMVETGMDPMEALRTATVHAAALLGASDDIGSLEAGKFADIVAVKGDPIRDIRVTEDVHFVMKEGSIYKSE